MCGTWTANREPSRKGFGEGWARMAEGSEKQNLHLSYPIEHSLARFPPSAARFTRAS
jgi:hypothetical protein